MAHGDPYPITGKFQVDNSEVLAELAVLKIQVDSLARAVLELTQMVTTVQRALIPAPMEIDRRPLSEQASEILPELSVKREVTYGANYVPQAPGGRDRRKGGAK